MTEGTPGQSVRTLNPGPVRPQTSSHPVANTQTGGDTGPGASGAPSETEAEVMARRAEELTRQIEELEARIGMEEEEARRAMVKKAPEAPTQEEIEEHMVTHAPPKAWCKHCVRATATRDPHKRERREVPDVEAELKEVPTI